MWLLLISKHNTITKTNTSFHGCTQFFFVNAIVYTTPVIAYPQKLCNVIRPTICVSSDWEWQNQRGLRMVDRVASTMQVDGRQSGEYHAGGWSTAVYDQLHGVTGLRLVQLPSCQQDVPAQHSRYSTGRQVGRGDPRCRVDLRHSSLLQRRLSDTKL